MARLQPQTFSQSTGQPGPIIVLRSWKTREDVWISRINVVQMGKPPPGEAKRFALPESTQSQMGWLLVVPASSTAGAWVLQVSGLSCYYDGCPA